MILMGIFMDRQQQSGIQEEEAERFRMIVMTRAARWVLKIGTGVCA